MCKIGWQTRQLFFQHKLPDQQCHLFSINIRWRKRESNWKVSGRRVWKYCGRNRFIKITLSNIECLRFTYISNKGVCIISHLRMLLSVIFDPGQLNFLRFSEDWFLLILSKHIWSLSEWIPYANGKYKQIDVKFIFYHNPGLVEMQMPHK